MCVRGGFKLRNCFPNYIFVRTFLHSSSSCVVFQEALANAEYCVPEEQRVSHASGSASKVSLENVQLNWLDVAQDGRQVNLREISR